VHKVPLTIANVTVALVVASTAMPSHSLAAPLAGAAGASKMKSGQIFPGAWRRGSNLVSLPSST
jgi:hypothetical protein